MSYLEMYIGYEHNGVRNWDTRIVKIPCMLSEEAADAYAINYLKEEFAGYGTELAFVGVYDRNPAELHSCSHCCTKEE